MSEPTPAKFRKTKTGKWAVMAPIASLEKALKESAGVVQVLKKSGDTSTFTVGSLGKPFDVDGEQMCYGYSPEDSDEGGGPSSSGRGGGASSGSYASRPQRANRSTGSGEWPAESDASLEAGAFEATNLDEPPRDDSEPMPDFQGASEEEWDGGI